MFTNESSQSPRIPPGQKETKGFPVLTYGSTPVVDTATWQLKIWGYATRKTFSWQQIMAMPQKEFTADFHCVTTWSRLDLTWTGISIPDFLRYITIDGKATHVLQHCYGGYTTNLPLEDFCRAENFLAFALFGEPLPPEHGGPLRSVIPHLYAWKSAKWLHGLEFLDQDQSGFWERNGYHRRGDPWKEERYSFG